MELIDKSALVAEIERIEYETNYEPFTEEVLGKRKICKDIKDFLNTIKGKEVDLEKEIETHLKECLDIKFPTTDIKMITKDVEYTARKFFELGLKAQKGG